jgi:hypothetical protein
MLLHIALAAGLAACAADPATGSGYAPRTLPSAYQSAHHGAHIEHGVVHPSAGCSNCGGTWWHACGPQSFRCHFLFSPCDMHQHMPYWNNERGYYYFRPYHVAHVIMHQEQTASWGQDARNPYDNRTLEKIYDDWADEQEVLRKARQVEDLPNTPGRIEIQPPVQPEPTPPAPPAPGLQPQPNVQPEPEEGSSVGSGALKKFVKFR